MLGLFLIMLAVLSSAAILAYLVQHDEGFILINFGGTSIEVRFWFGLIVLTIAMFLVFWLFKKLRYFIITLGVSLSWWSENKHKKAEQNTYNGIVHFIEGNFSVAQKELLSAAKNIEEPYLHYLASAESAIALNNIDEAEFLLNKAKKHSGNHYMFILFCFARCDFLKQRYEQCIEKLESLLAQEKHNVQVLDLLARALINSNSFKKLSKLLPRLKKDRVFSAAEFQSIELNTYLSYLSQKVQFEKSDDLEAIKQALFDFWNELPKHLKHHPSIIEKYARQLVMVGLGDDALSLITIELNKNWNEKLVALYGTIESSNSRKQMEQAQKWSKEHGDDANLSLALGKIAMRSKLWGSAKEYIEMSISLNPSIEAFSALAKLYNELKEFDKEREYLYKSMAFLETKL